MAAEPRSLLVSECLFATASLCGLDEPVEVVWNGEAQTVQAKRTLRAVYESLRQRLDPASVATAYVDLAP